jgi:hypothetical protein
MAGIGGERRLGEIPEQSAEVQALAQKRTNDIAAGWRVQVDGLALRAAA